MPRQRYGAPRAINLISGDEIGLLVTIAVEQVMEAMYALVYLDCYQVRGDMKNASPKVIKSICKNKACLKGGLGSLWRVSSTLFAHIASDAVLKPLGQFAGSPIASNYPPICTGEFVEQELAVINLKGNKGEL
ncbi:unnamed protein product [Camellia sinensis]